MSSPGQRGLRPDQEAAATAAIAPGSARRPWETMWHHHPAVRSHDKLTIGERSADRVRNGMGSWAFVFGAVACLSIWILVNVLTTRSGRHAFDAYPFILLNLVLSCVAALQGAILLIAAKRTDQISSELAAHDYEVDQRAEKLIEENTELTRIIKDLSEAIHGLLTKDEPAGQPSPRSMTERADDVQLPFR